MRCVPCCARARPTGGARSAAARRSTSNMSRPIRPGRCMSAIAAARCSAMRCAACLHSPAIDVTREYYINDAGAQVDVLARSAFLRYREALGEDIGAIPEGLYPGDYLKPVGEALAEEHGDKLLTMPESAVAADRARQGDRDDDGRDQGRSRRAQHPARRVLLRALADRGPATTRSPRPSISCVPRAMSTRAACRRRRARRSRIMRTANRRCFAPPPMATTSTVR